MSEKVYRTAIYARLSKDDGDKVESNSIVSQKSLCEEYINRYDDLELVETFTDDGYSGVDFNRPGFKKLEQAIKDRKIEAIVCKDLSRFTRNYIEGGRYLEKIFPEYGVRFIAVNDGYDTLTGNPQSDSFVIPFKNLINDTYCKDISVKIRTNLDVKRRKGEYVGSYAPYGYLKDPGNKNRLVIDENAADIVKKIFSLYKEGKGIGNIAEKLNSLGISSPMEYKIASGINYVTAFSGHGMPQWSYNAVRRILSNEIYIGILTQGKRGTPNYKAHVVRKKDEAEWIRVEDAVPQIISYDDFMVVKTMLGRDTRSVSEGAEKNLFSGFVFCADCGQAMSRKVVPSGKKKYYYYTCSTKKNGRGCSSHNISTGDVERLVFNAIRLHITNVLDLEETLEYIENMSGGGACIFNYEAQITKAEEEIEKYKKLKFGLYQDLSENIIDKQEYMEFRARYVSLINEKEASLEKLRREKKEAALNGDAERAWVTLFKQHENIEELDRRILMTFVDKILIGDNKQIEVVFRYGDEYARAMEAVKAYKNEISVAG